MKQFPTSSEVDFVVIGSGAGGGIMAKQLSVAGFSVVVLEQGGWGKYGREHEYNKDEWLNLNLSGDERLMSDPSRQRNTFRRTDKEKAVRGTHSYGFSQQLVRDAALAGLDRPDAARVHRALLETIAAEPSAASDAVLLGRGYARLDETVAAAKWLRVAIDSSFREGTFRNFLAE